MEQMKNQIEMDKKTEIEIDGYKDFVFSNRQNKPFITQTIGRILNRIVDDYNSDIKKFGGRAITTYTSTSPETYIMLSYGRSRS